MKKILFAIVLMTAIVICFSTVYAFEREEAKDGVYFFIERLYSVDQVKVYQVFENGEELAVELDRKAIRKSDIKGFYASNIVHFYPVFNEDSLDEQLAKFYIVIQRNNGDRYKSEIYEYSNQDFVDEYDCTNKAVLSLRVLEEMIAQSDYELSLLTLLFMCSVIAWWIKFAVAALFKVKPINYVLRWGFLFSLIIIIAPLLFVTYNRIYDFTILAAVLAVCSGFELLYYRHKYNKQPHKSVIGFWIVSSSAVFTLFIAGYLLLPHFA